MGHADLIRKLDSLSPIQRVAMEQLIDTLAAESQPRSRERLERALAEARASWPRKMTADEIDAEVARMRADGHRG
jgi:hypothetical protein